MRKIYAERVKRASSFLLAFLIFALSFPSFSNVSHAEDEAFGIYAIPAGGAERGRMTLVEDFRDENFYPLGDGVKVEYETLFGMPAVTAEAEGGGSFYGVFENVLDLSQYNEIVFSLRAAGAAPSDFTFTVTFASGAERYTQSCTLSIGEGYDLYVPVAAFESRGATDHIYFTFSSNAEVESVTMSSLFADDRFTYSHVGLFGTDTFISDGEIELSESAIYPELTDGAGRIEAEKDGGEAQTGSIVCRVFVTGVTQGTMTLSVKERDEDYTGISTFNLFPGENVYSYIYNAEAGDDAYMLSFSGVTVTEGERLAVKGVSFSYYEKTIGEESIMPGSLSSCIMSSDGRYVTVKGTLSSSAVVKNIDGDIGIYSIGIWGDAEPRLVAKVDMSTLFDITFSSSDLGAPAYFFKFFAAEIGDDDLPGEIFTTALYPSVSGPAPQTPPSVIGVESWDTSAPFDADASFTVVEVNVDELVRDDASGGRFHSYAGEYYYFDVSAVAGLDMTLGFYISSGLLVYVRLVTSPGTEGAKYGTVDCGDRDAVMKYAAALDYLTERYPGIYGIVVGKRIDSFIYSENNSGDLMSYAENYAELLRITASVARVNIPSALVALPLGDGYVYREDSKDEAPRYDLMSGVGDLSCDPMLLAALLSKFMTDGSFPWYLCYECESAPYECAELISRYSLRLAQNAGATPSGNMLIWEPDGEVTYDDVYELSEKMSSSSLGTKSLIVNLIKSPGDVASVFKTMSFGAAGAKDVREYNAILSKEVSDKGHVYIKDFRRSYGVGDLIAGGSFVSLTTESGVSERVARALGVAGKGESGILLMKFDSPLGLSAATYVSFSFGLTGTEGKVYPVTFIVGDGEARCEYKYSVTSGSYESVTCRVDHSAVDAATFIAVEVPGEDDITFDLSSVSLLRDDRDEDAIKDSIGRADGDGDKRDDSIITILVIMTVVSLAVFTVITVKSDRKDKKNSKVEQKEHR